MCLNKVLENFLYQCGDTENTELDCELAKNSVFSVSLFFFDN